jgi:5'-3' exonuclease
MFFKPNIPQMTLIVDGAHALHRACHQPSYRELSNSVGMPTGAVYGFFRILTAAVSKFSATSVIVSFEGGHSARRTTLYNDYKMHSDSGGEGDEVKPDTGMTEFQYYMHQLSWVRSLLNCLGLINASVSGKEGDDVIFQSVALMKGDKVILSEDRDFCSLVSPTTTLYRPITQQSIGFEGFEEMTGFKSPQHYLYGKVLMGDGSDNIPSVMKGVGESTVKKVLASLNESELSPENILKAACSFNDWRCKKLADAPIANINRNLDLIDISRETFTNLEIMQLMHDLQHPPEPAIDKAQKLMYALEFGQEIRSYLEDISGRFSGGIREDMINKDYVLGRMMGTTTAVLGGLQ